MAFFGRVGNILRHAMNKQISSDLRLTPSAFQAMRCMSSAASSKVFVGGLSFSTDEQSLREAFANYGDIVDVSVSMDRNTGRSGGFGFVTFTSVEEASSAIQAMDGQDLHGRRVRVNYATDRPCGFGGTYGNAPYVAGSGYGGAYGNAPYGGAGSGSSYSNTGAYGGNIAGGYGGGSYGAGGTYSGSGTNYVNDGNFASGSNAYGGNVGGSSFGNNNAYDSFGTSRAGGNYSGSEMNHGNDVNFTSNGGYGSNSGKFGIAGGGVEGNDNYGSAARSVG